MERTTFPCHLVLLHESVASVISNFLKCKSIGEHQHLEQVLGIRRLKFARINVSTITALCSIYLPFESV